MSTEKKPEDGHSPEAAPTTVTQPVPGSEAEQSPPTAATAGDQKKYKFEEFVVESKIDAEQQEPPEQPPTTPIQLGNDDGDDGGLFIPSPAGEEQSPIECPRCGAVNNQDEPLCIECGIPLASSKKFVEEPPARTQKPTRGKQPTQKRASFSREKMAQYEDIEKVMRRAEEKRKEDAREVLPTKGKTFDPPNAHVLRGDGKNYEVNPETDERFTVSCSNCFRFKDGLGLRAAESYCAVFEIIGCPCGSREFRVTDNNFREDMARFKIDAKEFSQAFLKGAYDVLAKNKAIKFDKLA